MGNSKKESSDFVGSIFLNIPGKVKGKDRDSMESALAALRESGAFLVLSLSEGRLSSLTANEDGYVQLAAFATKDSENRFAVVEQNDDYKKDKDDDSSDKKDSGKSGKRSW